MANRFVLNETSYHGKGAILEIANEVKARGFKKCLVCSDAYFAGGFRECRKV